MNSMISERIGKIGWLQVVVVEGINSISNGITVCCCFNYMEVISWECREVDWTFYLQIFDGHNGISAAIFAKEHLLGNVLSAIPHGASREEWLQALPRALVAGFVKTDIEFQQKGFSTFSIPYCPFSWILHVIVRRVLMSHFILINHRGNFWDHRYICCDWWVDCYCCIRGRFTVHIRHPRRCGFSIDSWS